MGLLDIYDIEGHLIAIRLVELIERGSLPAKGWSSVAAENEHDRLQPVLRGELDGAIVIDCREFKIRSRVSNLEGPLTCPHPKRTEWQNQEGRVRNFGHDRTEARRRLAHGSVESRAKDAVERY
jgi:hypothetical protein